MSKKVYQEIAGRLQAMDNCLKANNLEWWQKHSDAMLQIVHDEMPSGSGFDAGTMLDDASTPAKLIFNTSYHYMNESGYYDGWYNYRVIVTASLTSGINIRITGKNTPNDIKEYMYELFAECLEHDI